MSKLQTKALERFRFLALKLVVFSFVTITGWAQTIEFLPGTYDANETATNATIIVTRIPATGTASVTFATSDLTAQSGADYFGTNGVLSFANGESYKILTIPIIDDLITEGTETLQVTLSNPTGASLGANRTATISILDNDQTFHFSAATYGVPEDAANALITVLRDGSDGVGSVDVQIAPGVNNPASGQDYSGSTTNLIFTNGQASYTFLIPIINDCQDETDETVSLTLINPVGGKVIDPTNAVLTIFDNDTDAGTVEFADLGPVNYSETGGRVIRVGVDRNCDSQGAITVDVIVDNPFGPLGTPWCIGNTNASENLDYTVGNNTLSWAAGDTARKFLTITILDDTEVELLESIVLILGNETGGVSIGTSPREYIVNIIDDEKPAGASDSSYNSLVVTPGANNTVYSVAYYSFGLSQGSSIIGGDFSAVNAVVRNGVARLNFDGSVDFTFNPGSGADGFVGQVLIQPDEQVLVAGGFTSFNNISRGGIARLNSDGSLENSFNPGAGANGSIMSIALQSDGKIIIGGDFTSYNNTARKNIARINADGSLDESFNPGSGADDIVYSVALQADGQILMGGYFTSIDGVERLGVARLNIDGSVDTTFAPFSGADDVVYSVQPQFDGKILIGGAFSFYDGEERSSIARLNSNGTLDHTFEPGAGVIGSVYSIILQPDGLPLIAGEFTSYNFTARTNVARLYLDGTLDTSFLDNYYNQQHPGPDGFVSSLAVQNDGNILIAGAFSKIGSGPGIDTRFNIARLLGGITAPAGNAPGNFEFASPTYSVDENVLNGLVSIGVRRLNGTLGTMKIDYTTVDGSARSNLNYTPVSGTFTWTDCDNTPQFITVPILDNSIVEGNKNFYIKLSNPVGAGIYVTNQPALGFQSKSEITIIDNDFNRGVVGFAAPVFTVNENDSSGNATITVTRTNGTSGSVTVQYATSNGSATHGFDYTGKTNSLTLLAGQTSGTFKIPVINDTAVEFEESVNLRLLSVTGGATLGLTNAALLIYDNENGRGSISFSTNGFFVNENAGTATITIRRMSGNLGTVTATVMTKELPTGFGAARAGVDYLSASNVLTFADGVTSQTITVPILEDRLIEGSEIINLIITNVTGGANLGFQTNATLTILDDDAYGQLSFSVANYFISEQLSSATITVIRTGGNAEEVAIDYSTASGTAIDGEDFSSTKGTLVFADGVTSQTFTVPILNDDLLEVNETVLLTLTNISKAGWGVITNATLTINDDEALSVPAGSLDTLFNPHPGANDFINSVTAQSDGKLIVAGQFTAFNGISRIRIARLNDDGGVDLSFDAGSGANDTIHAIAIQPDEKILVAGRFTTMGIRNRNAIARLNETGDIDTSFNPGAGADNPVYAVALQSDGKILIGGDFSTFNGTTRNRIARLNANGVLDSSFSSGAGADGSVYTVTPMSDGKVLIGGNFGSVAGDAGAAYLARLNADGSLDTSFLNLGLNGSVRTVAIQTDNKIVVGGSFTSVNGISRNYVARLNSDGSLDTAFNPGDGANNIVYSIALQTDGKVVVGGEFTRMGALDARRIARLNTDGSFDTSINFGEGANNFVANVFLQTDEKIVIAGGFTQVAGVPRHYIARFIGGEDSGPGLISFSAPDYVVNENGTNVNITLVRTGGSDGIVDVDLVSSDNTANGNDYTSINERITFINGETTKTITIPITADLLVEPSETFILSLTNGLFIGNPANATVTILDNDIQIDLSASSYTVNEQAAGGAVSISVIRSGSAIGTVTVNYATTPGTAIGDVDYTSTNGTLIFPAGQTSLNFIIPILDDTLVEGNEIFAITLSGVSSNATIGTATAPVTIVDNDFTPGSLNFSMSPYVVNEGIANATITIIRTNGSSGIVSLNYTTTNDTAKAGEDFTSVSGTVAFADGETNRSFTVPILDDLKVEGSESFTVIISNPTGGAIISGANSVAVIIDDNETGPGSLDTTFNPGSGANNLVRAIAAQTNGSVVIGGAFTAFDNTNRNYVARLNPNGSLDTLFDSGTGANAQVSSISIGMDGKANLGGSFSSINSVALNRVARLQTNGSVDAAFSQSNGLNASVNAVAAQPDGKVLVGGAFNQPTAGLTRLRANGSTDPGFAIASGVNGPVNAIVLQTNGNIVIGGDFSSVNGSGRAKVARIHADGLVDLSFVPTNNMTSGRVYAVSVQTDGKTIIGGDFVTGANSRIIRLNVDGSMDATFNFGNGTTNTIYAMALQVDGKIIIGGDFTNINGTNRNRFARLNSDGSLDTVFDPGSGADGTVYAISILPDGKVILGGDFTMINGTPRRGIARLNGDESGGISFISESISVGQIFLTISCHPGRSYVLQAIPSLGAGWTDLITNTAVGNSLTFSNSMSGFDQRFYRIRQVGP